MTGRVAIPGSAPVHSGDAQWSPARDPNQEITVTLMLGRPPAAADMASSLLSGTGPASPAAARQAMEADPKDLAAVAAFARQYGLTIVDQDSAKRTVHLRGTIAQMQKAFRVHLQNVMDATGASHLSYTGEISVPASLAGVVVAVLGLDQRPIAKPR